jgi:hypothetical protein
MHTLEKFRPGLTKLTQKGAARTLQMPSGATTPPPCLHRATPEDSRELHALSPEKAPPASGITGTKNPQQLLLIDAGLNKLQACYV